MDMQRNSNDKLSQDFAKDCKSVEDLQANIKELVAEMAAQRTEAAAMIAAVSKNCKLRMAYGRMNLADIKTKLLPLQAETGRNVGTVPANFPKTVQDLHSLSAAHLHALGAFYGQDFFAEPTAEEDLKEVGTGAGASMAAASMVAAAGGTIQPSYRYASAADDEEIGTGPRAVKKTAGMIAAGSSLGQPSTVGAAEDEEDDEAPAQDSSSEQPRKRRRAQGAVAAGAEGVTVATDVSKEARGVEDYDKEKALKQARKEFLKFLGLLPY